MNWYQGEDKPKSVQEVVIDVTDPKPVESKFGMMMLGSKYHMLRSNVWVTGYFRMDSDPGPYLLIRADGYIDKLKNQPFRVAHCFYRMEAGGLFAIFIDFPNLKEAGMPSNPFPFILFEMIRGLDMEEEQERIYDAINRSKLHICFAEGDGPGEESNGMWSGSSINAAYDVIVDISEDCRAALNKEWEALLGFHNSLSSGIKDFNASVQQMQTENPVSRNPIIDQSQNIDATTEEKITVDSSIDKEEGKEKKSNKNQIATGVGFGGGATFFVLNIVTDGAVPGGFLGGVIGFVIGYGLAWLVLTLGSRKGSE